jgi:hypothetical protein
LVLESENVTVVVSWVVSPMFNPRLPVMVRLTALTGPLGAGETGLLGEVGVLAPHAATRRAAARTHPGSLAAVVISVACREASARRRTNVLRVR